MDLVLFSAIPKVALFFLLLVAAALIAEVIYLAKKKMDNPEVTLPKSLQNLPGQKPLPAMAAVTTEIIAETPKKGRFTRKTTTIIISTLLVVLTIPVGLALVKQRQVVQKQAAGSNPISVSCQGGNPPRGLLIVHQFSSEAACNDCKNDPTDCLRQLVGQPSDHNVCPSGNNYIGTTTNPRDGKPTVCTDLGDCSNNTCSSNFPDCSAVQIDCLDNLGGGINAGNPTINCNNCGGAPTPTPATLTCNAACDPETSCSSGQQCLLVMVGDTTTTRCRNPQCADQSNCLCSSSLQCTSIAAFDGNWNPIANLNSIAAGQAVYFTTNGTTDDPQGITKARFRINADGNWQETTQKHGADFYIQYTVRTGGSYTVDTEVFNPTLGWK